MVLMTHDRFAILPKRCDYCNRLFWLEPYNIRYREVGIESGTIELCECTRLHFNDDIIVKIREVKMAKRIIKNTMADPQEMTCPHCRSVFTYTFEDIERRQRPFMVLGDVSDRVIVCPVCKRDIAMDRAQLVVAEENANEKEND